MRERPSRLELRLLNFKVMEGASLAVSESLSNESPPPSLKKL